MSEITAAKIERIAADREAAGRFLSKLAEFGVRFTGKVPSDRALAGAIRRREGFIAERVERLRSEADQAEIEAEALADFWAGNGEEISRVMSAPRALEEDPADLVAEFSDSGGGDSAAAPPVDLDSLPTEVGPGPLELDDKRPESTAAAGGEA